MFTFRAPFFFEDNEVLMHIKLREVQSNIFEILVPYTIEVIEWGLYAFEFRIHLR